MEKQIGKLERELQERGFSNSDNPLFNLSDDRVNSVYQRLQTDTKAEAISRDTTSWDEIKECVESHVSQYGDGALVIVSGAAPHIWGAIPYLEQRVGARYISATSHKLGIDLVANEDTMIKFDKGTKEDKEQKALDAIQVQMKRDLGVARNLGYDTIEAYLADREKVQNPRNVIFGAEETGLHTLYFGERDEQLHKVLLDFVNEAKPKSILYIHEDLNVEGMRRDFENGKPEFMGRLPRDEIFDYAKSQGIPVEFGAFGHRDRQSFGDFGMGRMIGLRGLSDFY
ncbi:MAG: hypothetical protein PVJ67_06650 [Candidatus Pacearchaeota archaeon]|jgi:hypothetical protein